MTPADSDQARAAVDVAPIPMSITRISDGLILYANALLGPLLGLQSQHIIGRETPDFYFDPTDRGALVKLVEKSGFVRDHELHLKKADGTDSWVILSMQSTTFDGEPAFIPGFYDVTARRQAEESLRESEEKWRSLIENAPVVIATVDDEGAILATNQAMPKPSPAQVIGTSVYDYIEDECHDRVRTALQDVFQMEDPGRLEIVGLGPSKTVAWYDVRLGPIMRDGRVAAATWIATDVTKRKRTVDELRDSEQLYRMVVESVSEVIYIVHLEGDPLAGSFRFGNARMKELLGYDTDEFRSDPGLWLRIIHPDDLPLVDETTRHMFATGESTTREYRMQHKESDRYIWLEDKVVPKVDETGKTVSFLGVARDITIRKQTEEALQKEREELEHEVEAVILRGSPFGLTFREHTVLRLVVKGKTDKAIGVVLSISRRTANKHVENIFAKMRCSSRTEATAKAFREHLVD